MKPRSRVPLTAFLAVLSLVSMVAISAWGYTVLGLAVARSQGVYPTAEQGMLDRVRRGYLRIHDVDVLYAGPNSFDGSQPHIWYVIAEVRADRRADGSALGKGGCDSPGSFFLNTKQGWVHVSEGAFPWIMGEFMTIFGLAGPGQSDPSTWWAPGQPAQHCQSA